MNNNLIIFHLFIVLFTEISCQKFSSNKKHSKFWLPLIIGLTIFIVIILISIILFYIRNKRTNKNEKIKRQIKDFILPMVNDDINEIDTDIKTII
jgi:UDP-N-acetylmuramyl pentapeptide phosphotransferase/UDP-N-acetylglucosamine-1-phosphate transferase